jgi:phospholipase/carboxylesterase
MTDNPHLSTELVTRGPDPRDADLVVIAVHGRNQSPGYLLEHLVEPVVVAGGLQGVSWLLPTAAGQSWYPQGFLAPFEQNQPSLDFTREAMDAVLASLEGTDRRRIVWAGFSQGACTVCDVIERHPDRWGGLLAFTGGLIGPPGTAMWLPDLLDGMPAYFGVGEADEWVPLWRVEETAEAFRAAGADVTLDVFTDREHVIREAEIERVRALLRHARTSG